MVRPRREGVPESDAIAKRHTTYAKASANQPGVSQGALFSGPSPEPGPRDAGLAKASDPANHAPFTLPDPGRVDYRFLLPSQRDALTERAVSLVEWVSRVFKDVDIPPCWIFDEKHPDAWLQVVLLERAYQQYVNSKNLADIAMIEKKLEETKTAIQRGSAKNCNWFECEPSFDHESTPAQMRAATLSKKVEARRLAYANADIAKDIYRTYGWPSYDENNEPYLTPASHIQHAQEAARSTA